MCLGAIALSSLSIIFALGNAKEYIEDYKREIRHCKSMKDWYYRLDQDYTGDTHTEHYDLCRAKDSYQRALSDQGKAFNRLLVVIGYKCNVRIWRGVYIADEYPLYVPDIP